MPIEHPEPTASTAKELYANALLCGFPSCTERLFKSTPGQAKRSLNSRIAHICARRENGPRWDPSMTPTESRSAENLILLCLDHANVIDLPENVGRYPADLLRQWKAKQLASYDAAVGGYVLSDDEVEEVLRVSNTTNIVLQARTIIIGGLGGSAPGASGGGGGAIGPGALGGPGGTVGRIILEGTNATAPGAGGGGGGVIAPGAILPDPSASPRGFEGVGHCAGIDGQDGLDTTISVGDEVLMRALGGKGGLAGTGIRMSTDRLSVSSLLLVNYGEIRDNLASLVGSGWQSVSVLNLPSQLVFPVFVIFEAGGVEVGEFTVSAAIRDPSGAERSRVSFPLTVIKNGDLLRIPRCLNLPVVVDFFGIWTVAISTLDRELSQVDVMVKRACEAE